MDSLWTILKYGAPLAVGGIIAYGVWHYTRGNAQISEDEQAEIEGIRSLQGWTQGSFTDPNILKPVASAGLQQIYFRSKLY